MAESLIKYAELTLEAQALIQKSITTTLAQDTFWDKFCDHKRYAANYDHIEYRKQILSDLSASDLVALTEGVTPAGLKVTVASFKCGVGDYGNYIGYTDKDVRYGYDNIVDMAQTELSNKALEVREGLEAKQFLAGKSTVTAEATYSATALKAHAILVKNKAKPLVNGMYGWIMTPEESIAVLAELADKITHTSQNNAVINGYIGEYAGFVLYTNSDDAMYGTENAKAVGYEIFLGKNNEGLPVVCTAIGDNNTQIIHKALGASGSLDPIDQRGTVGYKIQGFGTHIQGDEVILRGYHELAKITESVKPTESSKTGFVKSETSPAA